MQMKVIVKEMLEKTRKQETSVLYSVLLVCRQEQTPVIEAKQIMESMWSIDEDITC